MTICMLIGGTLIAAIAAFEAWRDWRCERPSVWIGYDHGSDVYADLCDGAAGKVDEISPRAAIDARRGDA